MQDEDESIRLFHDEMARIEEAGGAGGYLRKSLLHSLVVLIVGVAILAGIFVVLVTLPKDAEGRPVLLFAVPFSLACAAVAGYTLRRVRDFEWRFLCWLVLALGVGWPVLAFMDQAR